MKHRILESIARIADAVSRRCREVNFRDMTRRRNDAGAFWVGCLALVACLALAGCHGAERATRTALDVTAHAVASADSIVAREYTDAAQRELAAATDLDDYHRRMRRWDRAEEALRAIVQALYAAEAALDAADASGVRGALACVQTAAVDLLGALSALDVPIPQALARAVDTLGAFVGECRPTSLHRVDEPAHDIAEGHAALARHAIEARSLGGRDLHGDLLIDGLGVGARSRAADGACLLDIGVDGHVIDDPLATLDRGRLVEALGRLDGCIAIGEPVAASREIVDASLRVGTPRRAHAVAGRLDVALRARVERLARLLDARVTEVGARAAVVEAVGAGHGRSLLGPSASHGDNVMPISEIGNTYFRESTQPLFLRGIGGAP